MGDYLASLKTCLTSVGSLEFVKVVDLLSLTHEDWSTTHMLVVLVGHSSFYLH